MPLAAGPGRGIGQQGHGIGTDKGPIGIGIPLANVTHASGSQEGIGDRMGHRIGVAMADQPGPLKHDTTQHHGSVRIVTERMDIKALSDPHIRNRQ